MIWKFQNFFQNDNKQKIIIDEQVNLIEKKN